MKPNQILLDLDGVLSNFLGLAIERLNQALNRDEPVPDMDERMFALIGNWSIAEVYAISDDQFWETLEHKDDFWCSIAPFPWARELYEWLKTIAPVTICTSPSLHPKCAGQKIEWAMRHLGIHNSGMMIGGRKHLMARPGSVLIDDYPKNCAAFREAGGVAIQVPSNWNTHPLTFEAVQSSIRDGLESALGATGQYPDGKASPDDEGELQLAISHTQDQVLLNFGKPIEWLGMDRDSAIKFARLLATHATQLRP